MKKSLWILMVVMFCSAAFTTQQGRTITGKVFDDYGLPMPGVNVLIKGTTNGTVTNASGEYSITLSTSNGTLVFSFIGYNTKEVVVGNSNVINVTLNAEVSELEEVVVIGYAVERKAEVTGSVSKIRGKKSYDQPGPNWNTEEYDGINENIFHGALKNPLSTFSIDVDAASYSNMRRFINSGQLPPKDAVRIEELINYFDYDYQQPNGQHPFAFHTEISSAPWNTKHKLVHIGLQGKSIPTRDLPPSNLVFLIDVSGSMSDYNKLPLLKSSFKMLVEQLRPQDHIAIVVYAGAAGLVLDSTPGNEKRKILDALEKLEAGGSTAGGAGINLAYSVAKKNFVENGNNRIILATDGDFNIGESSNAAMEGLIEEKRKEGVFLTVLGYGMGNYKDSKMEVLADKGNGNYAYIDNINEARKVLVNEFGGTLFTIAKDVKLQVEFNPAKVQAYRLIGYENRMLKNEDFNNDKKDAGDLGSGHTVTALYEIIPVGVESEFYKIDDLKYQKTTVTSKAKQSSELMTIKFRYKEPQGSTSKLIVHPVIDDQKSLSETSDNFRWSASVAAFGMLLRQSEYVNSYNYTAVIEMAEKSKGHDSQGYRTEFVNLVKSVNHLPRP